MVNVAVVGMGVAGYGHARFFLNATKVNLVAVVDPVPNNYVGLMPDMVKVYGSLSDLWASSLHVDVISVCAPPGMHHLLVTEVLTRGISCICEKPLAPTASLAIELAFTAHTLMPLIPVHNYRYAPWWLSLRSTIADFGGAEKLTVIIERPSAASGVHAWQAGWRMSQDISGGGILWDIGVHALYLAQDLFESSPVAATALNWREKRECEVECEVLFEFSDNRLLHFIGSWESKRHRSVWTAKAGVKTKGSSASLTHRGFRTGEELVRHSSTGTGRWLGGVFGEYIDSRQGGCRWLATLRSSVLSVMALEAARASARDSGIRTPLNSAYVAAAAALVGDYV